MRCHLASTYPTEAGGVRGRGFGFSVFICTRLPLTANGGRHSHPGRGNGGDEQTLQQTYSPEGSARCVQSFDDSLILQFA
jgi:hypothetical protein